jgi:UDP-N-acetylglucosamine 2-epimerase (non-hydrolysing)
VLKVLTVVGTRPEIIKLSRVIALLDECTQHTLVHTGQNYDYELNQIFFDEMGIRKPDYFLDAATASSSKTIANVISKSDDLFCELKPEALLLYGDTNSCLCAIAAKKHKIPIFHMEAGNRSFDERVPEEVNRRIIDHISDINMPLTEHAKNYLIAEGFPQNRIVKTGSCMREVLKYYKEKIDSSSILEKENLVKGEYFVVSLHREENIDSDDVFEKLPEVLSSIANKYQKPIIFSTHPRTMKKIEEKKISKLSSLIRFQKPYGFFDYVFLQKNAFCVVSDSGTITEESAILGFNAVTIRFAHERPEGMDSGVLTMSSMDEKSVLESIDSALRVGTCTDIPDDYRVEDVSKKVIKTIYSYTDFVNKTIWRKT